MKFLRLLVAIFIFKAIAVANDFDVYSAFDKAQKENKPLFYVVVSAGCPHCVSFFENTIHPNFEMIHRDFEFAFSDISRGDKIPSNIKFNGTTPSTYIVTPNGQTIVGPLEGNFDSKYLHYLVSEMRKSYAKNYLQ
ncbi:MAG: hypothetical protein AB7D43_10645 [Sulfurimonadaceae bacterium]